MKKGIIDDLYDNDGNIIEENWVMSEDLVDLVNEHLNSVDLSKLDSVKNNRIEEFLAEQNIKVLNLTGKRAINNLCTEEDFIEYLKIRKANVVFKFMTEVTDFEDASFLSDFLKSKLDRYDSGCGDRLDLQIKEFIQSNNIKVYTLQYSDIFSFGITFSAEMDFIDDIERDLLTCAEKIKEEVEVIEYLEKNKKLNDALSEIDGLYSFIISDGAFISCKNDKQRKLYKDKGSYFENNMFSNIKDLVENKPKVNTDDYVFYKPLYQALDDIFDKAKEYVKIYGK